ncbi:MAG: hypothetical protein KKB70_05335 [Proteobacteria bacterium]|nr:hypothetical protein [Pseudomonadota bacterium]
MSTELDMLATMLAEEMQEREADQEKHEAMMAKERARSERLTALEGAVAGIQRTLQDLIAAIQADEKKPDPEDKAEKAAMTRIEKLLQALKPDKTEPKKMAVTFDVVRDELGNIKRIVPTRK